MCLATWHYVRMYKCVERMNHEFILMHSTSFCWQRLICCTLLFFFPTYFINEKSHSVQSIHIIFSSFFLFFFSLSILIFEQKANFSRLFAKIIYCINNNLKYCSKTPFCASCLWSLLRRFSNIFSFTFRYPLDAIASHRFFLTFVLHLTNLRPKCIFFLFPVSVVICLEFHF